MKKKLIPIIMALVGKKIFAIVPLFLVGLAVLAFKALITAKIALLLAGILTISKAFGSGGGGGSGGGLLGKVAGLSGGGILSALSSGLGGGSAGNYANSGSSGSGGYASSGSQAGGWSSGSGNAAYPYARSYDEAQDLAYSGHVQTE